MNPLFLSLPWILVALYLILFFRNPRTIPGSPRVEGGVKPSVSVIVPARNEEFGVGQCVSSLCGSDYPDFEVLVVDDESQDRTGEIVQNLPPGNASQLRLIKGRPPPKGWFGKSWACWQGAELARGELLLFTDADTIHSPDLLRKTVSGLQEDAADVYTVIGRQIMGSFWERVLQPQFFMLLAARYPRAGTSKEPHQWNQAIANGQYLLFTREVYEASGGHRSVAGEVVEDLRFAQLLVRGGWKLVMRGTDGLQTRMYRSFGGLVEGWSKNIATAALQTTAPWLLPVILPLSFVVGVMLWLLPPTVLIWNLIAGGPESALVWGGFTTGLSVFIWSSASIRMYSNPLFGLLYPLGALLGLYIFVKSWWKGTRIRWKDRDYLMPQKARTVPPTNRASSGPGPGG